MACRLLSDLRSTEFAAAYASNPHELGRLLECDSLISMGEIVMHSSLARRPAAGILDFHRLDYPEMDPPDWQKLLPVKLVDNEVIIRELSLNHHLEPPYAPTYEENYSRYSHPL